MKEKVLVATADMTKKEGCFISARFSTMHENLCLKIKGATEGSYTLYAFNSKGEREEIYTASLTHTVEYRFDPIGLAVYHDSQEFDVEIRTEEAFEFSVVEEHDENAASAEEIVDFTEPMENGRMGVMIKRIDGVRELIPTVPRKAIIMGNSLVLGMFGAFGMCASSYDKDYFNYVTKEIKKYNPDCEFVRMHGSGLEQSPGDEGYSKWMYEEPNPGTGKPTYLSFTPDTDLIIIQLTDNVNTDEKVVDFDARIDKFLDTVRAMCPKARIIWVHGWYNELRTVETLKRVCAERDITRISIKDLCTVQNQAREQKYATKPNGEVIETPERYMTHPGDIGMKKIADRIIGALKLG